MTSHFPLRLRDRLLSLLIVLCAFFALPGPEAAAALRPEQLAIVINDADPNMPATA